jgi:RNA polymerase sigma factor for flagellar operon FliA
MKAPRKHAKRASAVKSRKAMPSEKEMIKAYLPLVRLIAEKIHRRLPPGVDLESLVHAGVVGLMEALKRYDPRRGVDFEIYARYRIQGEVVQSLRSLDWVSRSVRAWGRKMEAARSRVAGKLAREPTAEEIANELEVPLDTYYRLDQQINDAVLVSLDDLSTASEGEWEKTQERCSQNPYLDPLCVVESKDLVQKLATAIDELPERERLVLTLYYYEEMTLREIGEVLDLSEGRICQIFAQAVARLRLALDTDTTGTASRRNIAAPRKMGDSKRPVPA